MVAQGKWSFYACAIITLSVAAGLKPRLHKSLWTLPFNVEGFLLKLFDKKSTIGFGLNLYLWTSSCVTLRKQCMQNGSVCYLGLV